MNREFKAVNFEWQLLKTEETKYFNSDSSKIHRPVFCNDINWENIKQRRCKLSYQCIQNDETEICNTDCYLRQKRYSHSSPHRQQNCNIELSHLNIT